MASYMQVFMYACLYVCLQPRWGIKPGASSEAPDHRSRAAKSDVVVRCFTLTGVKKIQRATHGRRGSTANERNRFLNQMGVATALGGGGVPEGVLYTCLQLHMSSYAHKYKVENCPTDLIFVVSPRSGFSSNQASWTRMRAAAPCPP